MMMKLETLFYQKLRAIEVLKNTYVEPSLNKQPTSVLNTNKNSKIQNKEDKENSINEKENANTQK